MRSATGRRQQEIQSVSESSPISVAQSRCFSALATDAEVHSHADWSHTGWRLAEDALMLCRSRCLRVADAATRLGSLVVALVPRILRRVATHLSLTLTLENTAYGGVHSTNAAFACSFAGREKRDSQIGRLRRLNRAPLACCSIAIAAVTSQRERVHSPSLNAPPLAGCDCGRGRRR